MEKEQVKGIPFNKRKADWKKLKQTAARFAAGTAQAFVVGAATAAGAALTARMLANNQQQGDLIPFPRSKMG